MGGWSHEAQEEKLWPVAPACNARTKKGPCDAVAVFAVWWPGEAMMLRCGHCAGQIVGLGKVMGFHTPVLLWNLYRPTLVEARRAAFAASLLTGKCPRYEGTSWRFKEHVWDDGDVRTNAGQVCEFCGAERVYD